MAVMVSCLSLGDNGAKQKDSIHHSSLKVVDSDCVLERGSGALNDSTCALKNAEPSTRMPAH